MIHVVCVATETNGYLEFLEASCRRFGLSLVKLKWGQAWKGYMDKINCIIDYLTTLPSDDTILFVDGYDTLLVRDPNELETLFGHDTITVAVEHSDGLSFYASASRFGTVDHELINSGTYFGAVRLLMQAFQSMTETMHDYNDDQLFFTDMINKNRTLFTLDKQCRLAAVCADDAMRDAVHVEPETLLVRFRYNTVDATPFVLHYTFNGDMLPVIKALKYNCITSKHQQRRHYLFNLLIHHMTAYLWTLWILVCVIILLIVVLILLYYTVGPFFVALGGEERKKDR